MNSILRTALRQTIFVFALFLLLAQAAGAQTTISSLRLITETDRDITVGQTATATVTLSSPAPSGGTVVTLQSSQPTAATVPVNLTIAQGATTGNFTITGAAPTGGTAAVITASLGSSQAVEAMVVRPAPLAPVLALTVDRNTVLAGGTVRATITLSGPAPAGGRVINMYAGPYTNYEGPFTTYTANFTIPAGATSQVVPIVFAGTIPGLPKLFNIRVDTPCPSPCSNSNLYVASREVRALAKIGIRSISILPATVFGGSTVTGTVTLTDPVSTDTPLQILIGGSADGTTGITPPSIPIVPVRAGLDSATFSFQAPMVRAEGSWSGIATIVGDPTDIGIYSRFIIKPIIITDFRLTPTTVTGNRNSTFTVTGTVTLTGPAPAGGALIKPFPGMSGYGMHVGRFEFPESVIPQGQSSGTVTLTVGNVSSDLNLPILAMYQATNSQQTQILQIRYNENPPPQAPPQLANSANVRPELASGAVRTTTMAATLASAKVVLASISLNPGSVKAGAKTTLTATLSGAAPENGAAVVVKLEGVSATLTIPKGQTSATTALVAPKVLRATNVKVSAEYDGVTKITELGITP